MTTDAAAGEWQQHKAMVDTAPLLVHWDLHDHPYPACRLAGLPRVPQILPVVVLLPGADRRPLELEMVTKIVHSDVSSAELPGRPAYDRLVWDGSAFCHDEQLHWCAGIFLT